MDYQLHQRMQEMSCIGESRHQAKKEYSEIYGSNTSNRTVGIHSFKTYDAYKQTSKEFVKYIRQNYKDIKDVNQITKEVAIIYLQNRQRDGKSAYTISKDMAAINKLFNFYITKKEAGIKERTYKDVKRSREEKVNDTKYNPQNYKYQIIFAKATGCRRQSVLKVKPEDFIYDKNGLPQKVYLKEKGGRKRLATIIKEYQSELKLFLGKKVNDEPIFDKYTKKIDNHAFRAEYAKNRYKELVSQKGKDNMDFRGYDKECLEKLTQDMGHNRIDIVVYHYLR
jgi:integrase